MFEVLIAVRLYHLPALDYPMVSRKLMGRAFSACTPGMNVL
jgi:hypothetical protein